MANRAPTLDPHVFSIRDLKEHGSRKLPKLYEEYYNHGAMDMLSLRDNEAAYDRYRIIPRVLRNVSNLDTSTTICGVKIALPLGFSPSAMQCMAHPDGEIGTSRAAAKFGIPMCLSSYATTSLEDVIQQSSGNPYMMQMCVVKDRNITFQLLKRAEAAGYKSLFLSVDVPALGRRLNEMRNEFALPENMTFPNILSEGGQEFNTSEEEKANGPKAFDDSLEWEEVIPWLRKNTKMQIWLKGVISPLDVELAIAQGVDGIVISNHGGRQLDGVPATLDVLEECAKAAQGRIPLAIDGGIRRGSDVFKALALGASYCFMGRIAIWGLAYKGQAGVELALKILQHELQVTMALAGCRTISDITREHVRRLENSGILARL
ncbi:FMN-dependent dehydrogenase [Aaosphaeria arxii CBS 175.79]|uniref:Oxidase FUB9 n=1 Tax=Aaosphaeria arxii CBS 175.79 TaxID=1450172 RepID=A0A6A5XAC6_9PLEO|nr:FMN-dependent dehydrogenase [Aaosphaeria arxii CBS 175.79]KAF2009727.1 FMN-dependent dehydrogenase [Aaosphaeria arxii CBS 175.79]